MYTANIKFNKKHFTVTILPKANNKYDMEIVTKSGFSGNEYMALKKYLEEEGYVEAARKWMSQV
jgi:hypothetical protein